MRAIVVRETGGPGVLTWETVPTLTPGPRDAIVRVSAAGVNFVDTYYRSGEYKTDLPMTPGMEAEGWVESVGSDVVDIEPGDRVAFAMYLGAYAEQVRIPAERLVIVPPTLPPNLAAAGLLQAMTAHFLANDLYPLETGQFVLVHAGSGGLGQLLLQTLVPFGVRTIATVSTSEKAKVAARAGAEHVINYHDQDFVAEVARITDGHGVAVVFDSVGQDTWSQSLSCVQARGMLVLSGQSSGPAGPVDPQRLRAQGSILLARPSLTHFISGPTELRQRAGVVLGQLAEASLTVNVVADFPLEQAADAHRLLESRRTLGKILLLAPGDRA